MEKSEKIKQILYEFLDKVSEKKIQKMLSEGKNAELIFKVLKNCIPKVKLLDANQDENFGILTEGLMHYLLTNTLISSQRKIEKNGIEINLIIPDMKTLNASPKDALVILFPKTDDKKIIENKIKKIKTIQPENENIWLVLKENLELELKTFEILGTKRSFKQIIDEILEFLSSRKQNKLKIFKS